MKLYATIENEKGKKDGIGGNERLDIDIRVGNTFLGGFSVKRELSPDTDKMSWVIVDEYDEIIKWLEDDDKTKGEVRTT